MTTHAAHDTSCEGYSPCCRVDGFAAQLVNVSRSSDLIIMSRPRAYAFGNTLQYDLQHQHKPEDLAWTCGFCENVLDLKQDTCDVCGRKNPVVESSSLVDRPSDDEFVQILKQPANELDCVAGSPVIFSVIISKPVGRSIKYQWYLNGNALDDDRLADYKGSRTSNLVVLECLSKHQGCYECLVTDESSGVRKTTEKAELLLGMYNIHTHDMFFFMCGIQYNQCLCVFPRLQE